MVRLDTQTPFGEITPDDHTFRQEILEIAQLRESRDIARRWAENLRFLTTPVRQEDLLDTTNSSDSNDDSDTDDSAVSHGSIHSEPTSDEPCSCSEKILSTDHETSNTLILTSRDDFPDCVHYVAVSYCWDAVAAGIHEDENNNHVYTTVRTPSETRAPNAPVDVLRRAMRFAAHWDEPFVWIDQECIEQENPDDKEYGIQAMDIVYQRSVRPVGLLTCYIRTQEQMDILIALIEGVDIEPEQVTHLVDVLDMLARDLWFTRAWILQESVVGGLAMSLLIRHAPGLDKPGTLGDIPGEAEFDIFALLSGFEWAYSCIGRMEDDASVDTSVIRQLHESIDLIRAAQPGHVPDHWRDIDGNPQYRQRCNVAQALAFLERRKNTRIADRLAILANLCDFSVRINTLRAEERNASLSLCAFVLGLLNGDLSLVDAWSSGEDSSGEYTSEERRLAYSWGPPRTWCLAGTQWDSDVYLYRMQGVQLGERGLRMSGWMWCVDMCLDVGDIRDVYRRVEERFDLADVSVLRTLYMEVASRFMRRLREKGMTALAELIPRSSRTREAYEEGLSFEENLQRTREAELERADQNLAIRDSDQRLWRLDFERSVRRRVLFDVVCQRGRVFLGRVVRGPGVEASGDGLPRQYRGMFDASVGLNDNILVPYLQYGDHVARSTAQVREFTQVSWKVDICENDSSVPVVRGQQIVRGIWTIDEEDPGEYILS